MSFLKISDPVKRDLIVKEYLEIKKNIRDNLLSERTGEQQLQTDLSTEIADKYLNKTPGRSHDETFGMRKMEGLYYIASYYL